MDSVALREERAKLVIEARQIIDNAEKDNGRSLTGEENAKWEKIMSDVDTLAEKINTSEKVEATRKGRTGTQQVVPQDQPRRPPEQEGLQPG